MSDAYPVTATEVTPQAVLRRLASGAMIAQAIHVMARLGLADALTGGPMSADALAQTVGAHEPSLYRLLRALAAFDVIDEIAPGEFALTPIGACLRTDTPDSLRDAALLWGSEQFMRTTSDMLNSVRTGESAFQHLFGTSAFDYYRDHPDVAAMMNAYWVALGRGIAPAVVAAYDFASAGLIVDVGGNRGQTLATILRAHPSVRGVLFDLPHVIAEAGRYLEQTGVADRCVLSGGDMFVEVPPGGNTYLLSRVIHDWDDARAKIILRNCRRAMRPQTSLLLIERVLPASLDHSPVVQEAVTIDLTMLLRTGGRERTDVEYEVLLAEAGFSLDRIIPTRSGFSIVKCVAAPSAS